MRAPEDMPRRRRGRGSGRGRVILLVTAAVLFVLFTSLRGLAGFYTDYLWFDSLDLTQVWTGVLWSKVFLGALFTLIFFAICFVSLTIADRIAPKFRATGPEDDLLNRYHEVVDRRAGLVRGGVSLLFGLVAGVGVSAQWNEWILFRNGGDFGREDAVFGQDVGFYVFKLPFITAVIDWAFASLVIILLITVVAHYLNGGIRLQSPFQRVTPQVKAHLSVLLALLALIKAVDYWFARYELTFSSRGVVDGATYTDVHAQLPATNLLLLISLLSCALFIVNIWRRGWVLPVVAVGLWGFVAIVAGALYPTFIQRVRVEPQESSREAEYIGNNIAATREALGLADVEVQEFDYNGYDGDAEQAAEAVRQNEASLRNVRLLDPKVVLPTYQNLQAARGYYRFNELDVDRYQIETPTGETGETEVVLGNRDLNLGDLPQQSWEGRHIAYTHGYGVALSAANATTVNGQPDFLLRDVPVSASDRLAESIPELSRPQLYFGENLDNYAIVGTTRDEVDYLDEFGETVPYRYEGDGGVQINSWMRQAAFFLRFNFEWNLLFSDFITSDSRVLYIRDVRERFETTAPFLKFDADPYPVVVDGRVVYMIDAFTTSDRYPNAERADTSGLSSDSGLAGEDFDYVRNSVKGVLDAYEGTVKLYVVDPEDPIANAYAKAFPDLFDDADEMEPDLRDHFRYPEDLFRVQTNMWGSYHISDPQSFYEGSNGWAVAQDPGTAVTTGVGQETQTTTQSGQPVRTLAPRINPVYVIGKLPDEESEQFMMLRSFVQVSDDDRLRQLTAFMVAKSDPGDYGKLVVYQMPSDRLPNGPGLVNSVIQQNQVVSQQISLLNREGSRVSYGDLILVPINDTILYVRPLYLSSQGATPVPELKQVIVVWGGEVVMKPTLREAIQEMFAGVDIATFELPGERQEAPVTEGETGESTTTSTSTTTTTTPPTGEPTQDPAQLLAEASQLFEEAQTAAGAGDFGTYGTKLGQAIEKVEQAQRMLAATSTTTTSEPSAEA